MDFETFKSSRLNPDQLQATPNCLSDTAIALIVTNGAMEDAAKASQLDHIAGCDWCSTRLRLLLDSSRQPQARPPYRYAAFAAAALLILTAGAALYWYTNTAGRAAQMLAQAYTQSRTTDWRLPDAGWAPVTAARGAETPRPASLLQALSLLGSASATEPALQALRGRADILEFRAGNAIRTLEALRAAAPPSADLLCDLAVAYAVAADLRNQDGHYERTVEYALQARRIDPNHRRANFNLAIAYERLHMLDQAATEWEAYLARESDPGWLAEARERLARLNQRRNSRAALLPNATTLIPELALDEAALTWLVSDREQALRTGQQLLVRHADPWLADAAREPYDGRPLREIVQSNRRGESDATLRLTATHAQLYPAGSAHAIRLALERLYALNRRMDAAACLTASTPLLALARQRRYAWITVQALSYTAICHQLAGHFGPSRQLHRQAIELATAAHLDAIAIRLHGVLHNARILDGDPYAAWQENWRNLGAIVDGPYPPARIHQSLMNYCHSAEQLGWNAAAWAFASAAADVAAIIPIHLVEAVNRSRAASLAARAGLQPEAARESARAGRLFAASSDGPTRERYQTSVKLLEGEVHWHAGRPRDALAILEPLAPLTVRDRERWHVARIIGLARRQIGRTTDAASALRESVDRVEAAAATLPSRADANRLRRNALDAYRALAEILIDRGDSRSALQVWLQAHGSNRAPDLVFLALPDGYAAWTGAGQSFHRITVSRSLIRQDAAALLAAVHDAHTDLDAARQTAQRLFTLLLAPLPIHLNTRPAWTILPDAELAALPFHALVDINGRWLGESSAITFSTSARTPIAPHRDADTLVVHSATVPALLAPLPQAREEAAAVTSRFPKATLLEGRAATSDAIRAALPRANLFHFSGHGYLAESLGGLWLADGPAGAALLRALPLPACKLAVLSACLTAEGASGGLANPEALVRSFLDAGAATVLASRWMIDSQATTLLMETFYDKLARSATPEQALGAAMAAVRAHPRYTHPYYWAAFHFYT